LKIEVSTGREGGEPVGVTKEYRERKYRERAAAKGLESFHISVKETDLWVSADRVLKKETEDLVFEYRGQLESYIQNHPEFAGTLDPYPADPFAPPMVKEMIRCTREIGVGPMASVAGAIAQFVGRGLLEWSEQAIVENGGDIFLRAKRPVTVSILAGESPLSERVGLKIFVRQMPLGVCASSGTVGHSLSMGKADAVCLISPSAVLADGAATALCNRVKGKRDLERIPEWADQIAGINGGTAILGDRMVSWGDVELVAIS
jgi:ApbE superfamily uncharacterized protein (UPF0280 family)